MPSALIEAAGGIGDLVRITPLVTVCHRLGFDVDLLIAPDYPDAGDLLHGARGVRRMFRDRSPWTGAGDADIAGLDESPYDVAIVTALAASRRRPVRAGRRLEFDRSCWLREGDGACVAAMARQLGWRGPLPPPFVMPSARSFDLPPGTVALHPGCKATWPWKKWHGFDALASRLPRVVIVGTPSDFDNGHTYFGRPFAWPAHAKCFAGVLNLADTAALLSECAALVSNDSGLMHVAAALGIPTFGIFGITSPAREALAVPNMLPVTKGLPCEAACRRAAWGRRDCEFHLECLRALTPDDVLDRLRDALPWILDPETAAAGAVATF
jgi:hypothetical protein